MSGSKGCPKGVEYFGYSTKSDKGKAQPDKVSRGLTGVEKLGGSQPAVKLAKGSKSNAPVHKHSGTESMGAPVKHMNAKHSGPAKKAGTDGKPAGVRSFGGKSV